MNAPCLHRPPLPAILFALLAHSGCLGVAWYDGELPALDGGTPIHEADAGTSHGPDAGEPGGWDGQGAYPGPCQMTVTADTTEKNGANRTITYYWDDALRIVRETVDYESDGVLERTIEYEWDDAHANSTVPCSPEGLPYHVEFPALDYAAGDPPYASVLHYEACPSSGIVTVPGRLTARTIHSPPTFTRPAQATRYAYSYDGQGRMVDIQRSFNPPHPDWPIPNPHDYADFEYDAQGRISVFGERFTAVGDSQGNYRAGLNRYAFAYDGTAVTVSYSNDYDSNKYTSRRVWDASQRLSRVEAGGAVTEVSWDASGNLAERRTTWSSGGQTIYRRDHVYDAEGRRATKVEKLGSSEVSIDPRNRYTYSYHPRGNLSRVDVDGYGFTDGTWYWVQTFEFDFSCWDG